MKMTKENAINIIFYMVVAVIAATMIFLFLFGLSGCDDRGHVQTRFCEGMGCRTGGIQWKIHEGEPAFCTGKVAYYYLIDPDGPEPMMRIQQSGLRMDACQENVYWVSGSPFYTDLTGCDIGLFTGPGGFNEGTFYRNFFSPDRSYKLFTSSNRMSRPGESEIYAACGFATIATTTPEYNPKYIAWDADISESAPYIAFVPPATGNLLQSEYDALMEPNPELPESGIDFDVVLIQQQGTKGAGFVIEMTGGIVPLDYNDAASLFQTAPFMYSYIVYTSEPMGALVGQFFTALVKTNIASVPVGLTVTESNIENTVFIARTDVFVVMAESLYDPDVPACEVYDQWSPADDPNTLNMNDPNFVPDPARIIECPVIPIGDNDVLRIEFVPDLNAFAEVSRHWKSGFNLDDIF